MDENLSSEVCNAPLSGPVIKPDIFLVLILAAAFVPRALKEKCCDALFPLPWVFFLVAYFQKFTDEIWNSLEIRLKVWFIHTESHVWVSLSSAFRNSYLSRPHGGFSASSPAAKESVIKDVNVKALGRYQGAKYKPDDVTPSDKNFKIVSRHTEGVYAGYY